MFLIHLLLGLLLTTVHAQVSAAISCPGSVPGHGTATFTVSLPEPGNYKVWVDMRGQGATANSVYLQLDDLYCANVGDWVDMPVGSFVWVDFTGGNPQAKIPSPLIAAGTHTVKLIGNGAEPGVAVDRILLTRDTSCVPVGNGDGCIGVVSTPTPTPIPTATPTPVLTPTPTPRKQQPSPTLKTLQVVSTAVTIQTTDLPQATTGVAYSAPVTATSTMLSDTLTLSVSGLPSGLALGSCTTSNSFSGTATSCTLAGTPAKKGNYQLVFTAVSASGVSASKTLRLQVR